MVRLKIFVSAIPLLIAGLLARGEFVVAPGPCIALGKSSVQLATSPWQTRFNVSFTDNPADATVRVQIVDRAESADFSVVDDVDASRSGSCPANDATQFVGVSATRLATAPVIYLSRNGDADYRIFVQSKTFSPRDAAALIVGAHGGPSRVAAVPLNAS
jgi:hypothetical protein